MLAVAYRLVYVFDQVGRLDGDNAVVELMVSHIMAGRHYAFFCGQAYMGTLEPYSIAAVAAVFGLNDVVLRAVPLVWGVLFVATFYPLTLLVFGRREALVALALAALAPPLLAVWGPSPRGGYSTMLFLGHVVLILAILLSRETRPSQRTRLALALGVVGGLAFWTHLLAAVCIGAAVVALFLRDPRIVLGRLPWLGGLGFLVGSAPLWIANLRNGFGTLALVGESGHGRKLGRAVHDLVTLHGPKILGVHDLVGEPAILLPPLGHAVAIGLLAALAWGITRSIGIAFHTLRDGERTIGPEIFVLLLGILLAVDLTSRYGTLNTERYLLPAYGALFPLVAAAIAPFIAGRPIRAGLLALAYVAVMTFGARDLHRALSSAPSFPFHLPDVVEFMEKRGIRYALADHGEALVNTYRSGEHVVLRDFGIGRYPLEEIPGWKIEAFLMRGDGKPMARALEAMRVSAKVERFARHALVYDLRLDEVVGGPLEKIGWRATATHGSADSALAVDGDPETRWGSHAPQTAGMAFEVDLGGEFDVSGVRLDGGKFITDGPRSLEVLGKLGADWHTLGEIERPQPGLYAEDGEVRLAHASIVEVRFPPRRMNALRLVQKGADPRYDWSIAELEVFTVSGPPRSG